MSTPVNRKRELQDLWPGDWSERRVREGYVYSVVTGDHQIEVFAFDHTSRLYAEVIEESSMFFTDGANSRELMSALAKDLNWQTAQRSGAKTPLRRYREEHDELARERAVLIMEKLKGQSHDQSRLETIEARLDELEARLYAPTIDRLDQHIEEHAQAVSRISQLLARAEQLIEEGNTDA